MDYNELSQQILSKTGGSENVAAVAHCATRLRLKINNENLIDEVGLKQIKGVLGVVLNGKELQVIIGPGVDRVYIAFIKSGDFKEKGEVADDNKPIEKKKENIFLKFTDFIAGSVLPTLPVIVAGGMISAVLVVLTLIFNLSNESGTYIVLNSVYTAAFMFLPIFVGYNAAQKLNVSPMLGALLGAVLVTPEINGIEGLNFLKIPIATAGYSSSILPVIFGVLFMSLVYKPIDKVMPKEIKFFAVPLLTMIITVPVTLIALGPIATWLGVIIGEALVWLNVNLGWVSVGIMGAISPFLIFSGTGSGLYAAIFVAFAENGFENFVMPGMLASNLAVGGAALATMTMLKNKDDKAMSLSAGLTAVFGITEPAVFGVLTRFKRPFIGATIGAAVGGLFAGFTHLAEYAFVSPGLASIIAFINPDGTFTNLIMAVLTMIIGFTVGFIATRLLGIEEGEH